MKYKKVSNETGLELEIVYGGINYPIIDIDSNNLTWEEYLNNYEEEYKPHVILIRKSIEENGLIGKTGEFAEDLVFKFNDGNSWLFTLMSWDNLMKAIINDYPDEIYKIMKEHFSYENLIAIKELGLLKIQFLKWVKEKYGINANIYHFIDITERIYIGFEIFKYGVLNKNKEGSFDVTNYGKTIIYKTEPYPTYEQAEEACINKIIEILQNRD